MTRETKAGLVVSGSFLCLVVLVFYCKLQGYGEASADARAAAASIEVPGEPVAISESETLEGDNQTTNPFAEMQPAPKPSTESLDLNPDTENSRKSTGNNASSVNRENQDHQSWGGEDSQKSMSRNTSATSEEKQSNDSVGSNKGSQGSQDSDYQLPPREGEGKNNATAPSSASDLSASESSVKEEPSKENGNHVNLGPIQDSKEQKGISKASLSLTNEGPTKQSVKEETTRSEDPAKEDGKSGKQAPGTLNPQASESALPAGKNDASDNVANSDLDVEPPPVPSQFKDKDPYHTLPKDTPKVVESPTPPPASGKLPRDQGLKKSIPSATESPGIKLHVPMPVPETAQARPSIQGLTGGVMPSPLVTPPPAGDTAPEPRVQLGRPMPAPSPTSQISQASTEDQQHAPAGFSAPAVTAPLPGSTYPQGGKAVPPNPMLPRVESYDEETYICKAGDTFASISTRYYHTDKYELALLAFNRHHPRAAMGIAQDPPVLQAGQAVYIPELRILEKQYLGAPGDSNPITQVAAPSPAPLDRGNSAPPTVPPVIMPPVKTWATPSGERTYQVSDKGEMFLAIAKKTLGNPDRWWEIHQLNPKYDPRYPVPAGTNLRMPADARVDTETAVPDKKQPVNEPKPMPIYPN